MKPPRRPPARAELVATICGALALVMAALVGAGAPGIGLGGVAVSVFTNTGVALVIVGVLVRIERAIHSRLEEAESAIRVLATQIDEQAERLDERLDALTDSVSGGAADAEPDALDERRARGVRQRQDRLVRGADERITGDVDEDSLGPSEDEPARRTSALPAPALVVLAAAAAVALVYVAISDDEPAETSAGGVEPAGTGSASSATPAAAPSPQESPFAVPIRGEQVVEAVVAPAIRDSCESVLQSPGTESYYTVDCFDPRGMRIDFTYHLGNPGIGIPDPASANGDCSRHPGLAETQLVPTDVGDVVVFCGTGTYVDLDVDGSSGDLGSGTNYNFTWVHPSRLNVTAVMRFQDPDSDDRTLRWADAYSHWLSSAALLLPPTGAPAAPIPVSPSPR